MNFEEETDNISVQTTSFAQKMAKKLIREAKIKNPPILLRDIINSLDFKIKVFPNDLGDDDGFCAEDKAICYNNKKSRERTRFTIAHELGHIFLGHNSKGEPSKINFYSKDEKEINANAFAAELLVPATMLKKEKLGDMSVTELAKKYEVSKDMMFWRLRTLRLDLKIGLLDVEIVTKKEKKWGELLHIKN
jgi:Zn-dependent peptidase ImmA (M78 family)